MLSNQWHRNKNEPIQINGYKFDDFKNFIAFIYSGYCTFNRNNIFAMVDLAEFYQIPYLKQLCDENMSKMNHNYGNILEFIEISKKYSLLQTIDALKGFIEENFEDIIEADEFLGISKSNIRDFVSLLEEQEDVFQVVYEWAEHQATKKQKSSKEYLDANDVIKAEIKEFLPYFDLKKMKKSFVAKYVVDRAYIFDSDDATEFWKTFDAVVKVKITNSQGQSLSCTLSYETNQPEIEIIKELCNCRSDNCRDDCVYWWWMKSVIPSAPNLKKKVAVDWYLIYFSDGNIGVKSSADIDSSDYLIAETFDDNCTKSFVPTTECKIDIIE